MSIARKSWDDYGISRERYLELRNGCREGRYNNKMLLNACRGFEFVGPWIILSVTKNKSYDHLEFDLKLGRIPCGRTNFYALRQLFYHNRDMALKKKDKTGSDIDMTRKADKNGTTESGEHVIMKRRKGEKAVAGRK